MQLYVATCFLCSSLDFSRNSVFLVARVMLSCFFKLMSRPSFSCHDSISVLSYCNNVSHVVIISVVTRQFNMGFFYRNQGSSTSKHLMSRPRFSCRDINFFLQCLNSEFIVAIKASTSALPLSPSSCSMLQ